jgi:hypothetical protein
MRETGREGLPAVPVLHVVITVYKQVLLASDPVLLVSLQRRVAAAACQGGTHSTCVQHSISYASST